MHDHHTGDAGQLFSHGRCHRWWWPGDLGIRYGYQRFDGVIMLATVVVLIALVQLLQMIGDRLQQHYDRSH